MQDKNKSKKEDTGLGYIKPREITSEMEESYLDYAMSVIVSRALPDVRDGLKPVHRRILYAMYEDGLRYTAKFRKSASVVGSVLSKYHPHGDSAVYDALVRMAQDFSLRYPLVQGQGNFGSIDGDSAAAYRYTEARLSKVGQEMLRDIEKETVDFRPNYDGTKKEPVVLPSPLPQLLLNGSLGIAVGMATNIPPHNLSEVIEAAIYLSDHPSATTEDLFQFIKGPDFPTGGIIYGKKEIISAYSQGKGPILVRGKAEIEEAKNGTSRIVITEIPFQVQKSSLVESFAKLVETKKINNVKDIRDESDREGMRIVIELKRGAFPKKILNALYKFTDLQKTFYLNMLALVDGIQPKVLSLVDVISFYLKHKEEIILRRTKFDLRKAKEREHILEGLMIALKNINKVIETIKKSADRKKARENLIKGFKLSPIQADAILEMKLQSLAKLERFNIEKELKELLAKIKEFEEILKSEKKVRELLKAELNFVKEQFGDQRKTKVIAAKPGEIGNEDLVPSEDTMIILTREGFIKRLPLSLSKLQKRGGKGVSGVETSQEDIVEHFLLANTLDQLLFFTDSGKVFKCFVWEIPEMSRTSKGRGILNFLEMSQNERIVSIASYSKKEEGKSSNYLIMATKNGIVKKTPLSAFKNVRKNGLTAIKLKKGDILRKAAFAVRKEEIILVTKKGKAIRFKEENVRPMQRGASGVKGINLGGGDEVVGMDITGRSGSKEISPSGKSAEKIAEYLLIVTGKGYSKKTKISDFRLQNRGGSGIKAAKITDKTGEIVFSKIIGKKASEIVVISKKGNVIRSKLSSVPVLGRATSGVKVMRLGKGDQVASAICIDSEY